LSGMSPSGGILCFKKVETRCRGRYRMLYTGRLSAVELSGHLHLYGGKHWSGSRDGESAGEAGKGKFVGVIGDSTFLHGGIAPLMNMAYNKSYATVILLDNRTTGMTGSQEHPGTGYTIRGEKTHKIDFIRLAEVLGLRVSER